MYIVKNVKKIYIIFRFPKIYFRNMFKYTEFDKYIFVI